LLLSDQAFDQCPVCGRSGMMRLLASVLLKVKRALWLSHFSSNMNPAATRENNYLKIKLAELDKFYQSIVGSNPSANNSKEISFSEILNTALPESSEVIDFNEFTNNIQSNKSIDSIGNYYLYIFNSVSALSEIIDAHWNEFTLETKMLLLFKLRYSRSKYLFWAKLIFEFILDSINPKGHTWKRRSAYYSLDRDSRKRIDRDFISNHKLVLQSFKTLQTISSKIFASDGKLYWKNKKNIGRFIDNLNQSKLRILSSKYTLADDPELLTYLQHKPGMFALLKDAYPNFIKYFNSRRLLLGIWNDIDNSDLKYLTLTIYVSEDIDNSLLVLDEFRDSYWFNLPWSLVKNIIMGFDC
jgi:hypothetical protein